MRKKKDLCENEEGAKVLVLKKLKNTTFNDDSVRTVVESMLLTTVLVRTVVVSSRSHL